MTNSWSLLYDTMNDDVIKFDVGEDTIEFSSKTPWKYNEEELLKELLEYIRGTYNLSLIHI